MKIKDNVHELPVCACASETHSGSPPTFYFYFGEVGLCLWDSQHHCVGVVSSTPVALWQLPQFQSLVLNVLL